MEFLIQVDEAHSKVDMYNRGYEMGKEFILFPHFTWCGKILIQIRLPKFICVHIPPRAATEKKYKSKANK